MATAPQPNARNTSATNPVRIGTTRDRPPILWFMVAAETDWNLIAHLRTHPPPGGQPSEQKRRREGACRPPGGQGAVSRPQDPPILTPATPADIRGEGQARNRGLL